MNFKGLQIKMTVNSTKKSRKIDNSGDYHCEAHDMSSGIFIRSNNIQIRDIFYWEESNK